MNQGKYILSQLMENGKMTKEELLKEFQELLSEAMQGMLGDILEALAYEEREMFFEEKRNDGRNVDGNRLPNRKNGFYNRKLLTHIGEVDLRIPRDRYGEFRPFFIDRYNRNLFTLSEIVISMYQGGLSTRDITKTMNNLLGNRYSPTWVSRITNRLIDKIDN